MFSRVHEFVLSMGSADQKPLVHVYFIVNVIGTWPLPQPEEPVTMVRCKQIGKNRALKRPGDGAAKHQRCPGRLSADGPEASLGNAVPPTARIRMDLKLFSKCNVMFDSIRRDAMIWN